MVSAEKKGIVLVRWVVGAAVWVGLTGAVAAVGPVFLLDTDRRPHVAVSWPTSDGRTVTVEGDKAYTDAAGKSFLGKNLEAYVAMGGARVDLGAADPKGAVVRVGFYKLTSGLPLFEGLSDNALITVTLRGVVFNQGATPRVESIVHHAKFEDFGSLLNCNASLGAAGAAGAIDLYNTTLTNDDFHGRITSKNTRFGVLGAGGEGSVSAQVETDGSVTMTARIPYKFFKHPDDPWLRNAPGTFVEPVHFHVEMEVLPAGDGR